jgi:hypothetical protein
MQKVINFYSGPCGGKSTAAAGLFYEMKREGYSVELVNEFAKECVWEDNIHILQDQLWVLAHQHRRVLRLRGKVDYIITDSPVLLSPIYRTMYGKSLYSDLIDKLARECYFNYDNIDIILNRPLEFIPEGRVQDYEQSLYVDKEIVRIFTDVIKKEFIQIDAKDSVCEVLKYIKGINNE